MSNVKSHDPERPTIRFYGCYLSSAFLELPGLDLPERVLLCAIEALSHNDAEACYASNAYLASILQCSVYEINKRVSRLVETGYLRRVLKPGTAEEIAALPAERKRKPGGMIRYLYPSESTPSTRTTQARKGTHSNERVPPAHAQPRTGTLSNERVGRLPIESLPDGQGTLSNGRDMSLESLSMNQAAAARVPESGAKGGAARAAGAAARPAAAALADKRLPEGTALDLPIPGAPGGEEMAIRGILLTVPDLAADLAADLARQARAKTPPYAPAEIERMRARAEKTATDPAAFVRWAIQRGERFPVTGSARASPEPAPPPAKPETARAAKAAQDASTRAQATRAYVQDLRASATRTPESLAEEAEARAEIAAMKARFAAEEATRRGSGGTR